MPHVITAPCIGTKDTACVNVCPSDGIHPGKSEAGFDAVEQLYIDPDACIDCGACAAECPVNAIVADSDCTGDQKKFIEKNADYYRLSGAEFQAKWNSAGRA